MSLVCAKYLFVIWIYIYSTISDVTRAVYPFLWLVSISNNDDDNIVKLTIHHDSTPDNVTAWDIGTGSVQTIYWRQDGYPLKYYSLDRKSFTQCPIFESCILFFLILMLQDRGFDILIENHVQWLGRPQIAHNVQNINSSADLNHLLIFVNNLIVNYFY